MSGIYDNSYEEIIDGQKIWEFDNNVFPIWSNTQSMMPQIQIPAPQFVTPLTQLLRMDSVIGNYDPVDRDVELLSKRVMKHINDSEMNDNSV